MKKIWLYLSMSFIIAIIFVGCNYSFSNIMYNKNKPNNFYYTNLLAKDLTLETSYKCIALDTNLCKEKEIDSENKLIFKNMLKSLNKNNFIAKPKDLPSKPAYKIFFTFNKEKMVISVYNEKFISIYPWDGNYDMDYIDMNGVPISLNLYSLCKFIFN
ncbi:DUF4883 family protein [Clostridium scatologenes]|uniref:Lipoprotein n=1 Tax=Clostridium scatologenes TaxID=1548 RepID=A0A0E3K1J2_CLOSL|nr:DUF4883 family protein [Clostridium scatologenes]AKA70045.1 hypothetical protein CSCA_2920 [Clostridium scatologenes]